VVTAARHGGRPLQSIPYEDIIRFKRMRNPETKKQGILFECTPVYGGELIFTVADCNSVYQGIRDQVPGQPSPTGAGFLTNICRGQIAKLVEERKKNSPGGRDGKPAARMPRMSVAVGSNSKPSSEQREVVESDATDAMAMAAAEVLEDLVEGEEEEEDEPAAGDSFAANAAAEVQLEV
jgi:hypothetical protein